ncbi:MAG: nucleotide-binding protein [Thermoanaerobacteraceae bacterium]|nr:nucleotide-binding protein [Thermoanaerobacteraceae bacterium]
MGYFKGSIEELKLMVTEIGFTGTWRKTTTGFQFKTPDGAILNWSPGTGRIWYQGKAEIKATLEQAVETRLSSGTYQIQHQDTNMAVGKRPADKEKVFVVHGHDTVAREQLELILHRLGLEPFVLANTGGGGMTLIEALEAEVGPGPGRARFGIVLMTPDDVGYSKVDGPEKAEPRARQNVVLEMGMLIAALKRPNVAILKKGHIEVPSDAQGIIYIPFNDHVKECVPRLVDRLRQAGFELDPVAITKASS